MSYITSILKKVPGVLWIDEPQLTSKEAGGHIKIDVIAHADAVNNMGQNVYVDTLYKMLEKEDKEVHNYQISVIKVRVESGLDSIKAELEEQEGILGVHISPLEWTEDKQVKKVQLVISADDTQFDSYIFETKFKQMVQKHNVRVSLKVDFVLYRPKKTSLIL